MCYEHIEAMIVALRLARRPGMPTLDGLEAILQQVQVSISVNSVEIWRVLSDIKSQQEDPCHPKF